MSVSEPESPGSAAPGEPEEELTTTGRIVGSKYSCSVYCTASV